VKTSPSNDETFNWPTKDFKIRRHTTDYKLPVRRYRLTDFNKIDCFGGTNATNKSNSQTLYWDLTPFIFSSAI
jgi:hypothetical protein